MTRSEEGFTLTELLLVMTIFGIIGSSLAGAIMVWFSVGQGSTGQAVLTRDSQFLAGYFVADLSSVTLPPSNTTCVSFADYPLNWTFGGVSYQADYKVVGTTVQRIFSTGGVAGSTTTVVHYLKAGTSPCITSQGTTRAMTLTTALSGVTDFDYTVTGHGRAPSITAVLSAVPPYFNSAQFALSGTYSDNVGSSITKVVYKACFGMSCSPTQVVATAPASPFSVPSGGWSFPATPAEGPFSVQSVVTSATTTMSSNVVTGVLDTHSPLVTLVAPANAGFVKTRIPAFSGGAGTVVPSTTSSADSTTVTVKIYAGAAITGSVLQTLTAMVAGGAWSVSPTTALIADGTYSAQASQVDGAGNVGFSASTTFVVDTAVPAVTLTTPPANSSTLSPKPTFGGSAGSIAASAAASADAPVVTVKIFAGTGTGGALVQTLTASATAGSWSVSPSVALAGGVYTAQASQSDGAGNMGVSLSNTFTEATTGANGLSVTPSSSISGGAGQENLALANPHSITSMSITINVAGGGTYSNQRDGFPSNSMSDGHGGSGGVIIYTFALKAGSGQNIAANYSGGLVGAQFSFSGNHSGPGDSWTVTSTSNGIVSTVTGHF